MTLRDWLQNKKNNVEKDNIVNWRLVLSIKRCATFSSGHGGTRRKHMQCDFLALTYLKSFYSNIAFLRQILMFRQNQKCLPLAQHRTSCWKSMKWPFVLLNLKNGRGLGNIHFSYIKRFPKRWKLSCSKRRKSYMTN